MPKRLWGIFAHILTFVVLVWIFVFFSGGLLRASNYLLYDDFTNGSTNQWNFSDFGWSVQNIYGSNRLGKTLDIPNSSSIALAGDTNWTDYSFDVDIFATEGSDKNLLFRYQDNSNTYGLHLVSNSDHQFDRIWLEKWEGGNFSDAWSIKDVYNNQVIHIRIETVGTRVRVLADGQLLFDLENWGSLTHGKIGLRVGTGASFPSTVWYDNIDVESLGNYPSPTPIPTTTPLPTQLPTDPPLPTLSPTLPPTPLPTLPLPSPTPTIQPTITPTPVPGYYVPLVKQTDPLWANVEYDSAKKWSPKHWGIEDWGCALTSAVMVMSRYSINKVPNGEGLSPQTLNSWLLSRPDGYVGNGLVNWAAISSMTMQSYEKFGSTILNFRKYSSFDTSVLDTDLANQQPDILGVLNNGHYVVATQKVGLTYQINDPSYNRSTLADYSNKANSIIHFYPTHTNLASFYFTTDSNIEMALFRSGSLVAGKSTNGQSVVPTDGNYGNSDLLFSDEQPNSTNGSRIKELFYPLPADENYELRVWSSKAADFKLKLIGYDQQGNPFVNNITGVADRNSPAVFNFGYSQIDANGIVDAHRQVNMGTLISDINLARDVGWIRNNLSEKSLLDLAIKLDKSIKRNDHHTAVATANLIRIDLWWSRVFGVINQPGMELILGDLNALGY